MSNEKFTEGPWRIGKDALKAIVSEREPDKNKPWFNGVPFSVAVTVDGDEYLRYANAKLIATAPEMYWMLEKCRTALHECGMWCLSEDVFNLLAKARGEKTNE